MTSVGRAPVGKMPLADLRHVRTLKGTGTEAGTTEEAAHRALSLAQIVSLPLFDDEAAAYGQRPEPAP